MIGILRQLYSDSPKIVNLVEPGYKCLVDQKKYDEAIPILERALKLTEDPNLTGKIYCLSTRLRNEKGEYELALKETASGLRIMNACRAYDLVIIDLLKRQEAIALEMASREKKTPIKVVCNRVIRNPSYRKLLLTDCPYDGADHFSKYRTWVR